ncbi:hypothetical protein HF086_017673 [Spodoptera exigua]|uniref:Peptidase S1 domain-containing protein n=1 Tax=Spodoptera exigua TaxID=7107 RepID=A0A922MGI6_SPOEX|nr:hypothetical protein HF086_017673 [Spodoptera exigua]
MTVARDFSNRQRFYELVGNTKNHLPILVVLYTESHGERRIIDGNEVSEDKSYVVYLVKAPFSNKIYDSWLCGGALVSKEFILTSAACVEDVDFLYAIAGYKKYVKDKFIEHDDCTKTMKKKVIYTCVPVVKVESPFNLFDARFQIMCSYIPTIVRINFDPKHQVPGTEAMVFGWGHTEMWRECQSETNKDSILVDYDNYPKDETRKRMNTNEKNSNESLTDEKTPNFNFNKTFTKERMEYRIGRRNGICQVIVIGVASVFKIDEENKCVGPYLYTSTVCSSAFLHCTLNEEPPKVPIPKNNTSQNNTTQNNTIKNNTTNSNRKAFCNSPPSVRGYDTIERFVSWKDHPSGPADNEKASLRSKAMKKDDKFATRVESYEDSNENNPLRDRNTQKVSFPKNLSGKYKAQARFLAQIKEKKELSETKADSSEEKEIVDFLNPLSEKVVLSTVSPQTLNDPLYSSPSSNIELSNLDLPPEARLPSNSGPQQIRPDAEPKLQMRLYTGLPSNLQSPPEMRQAHIGYSWNRSPLQTKQNPWQSQNLASPQRLGFPPNHRPLPNLRPAPYLGPSLHPGPPKILGPPQYLGVKQNMKQNNPGRPSHVRPLQNLDYPKNLGSPLILGNSQNLSTLQKPAQKLDSLQNLRFPQNLGPPKNFVLPQNMAVSQNLGRLPNLGLPHGQGFQQNLGSPQTFTQPHSVRARQNNESPQKLMPLQNLGVPLKLRPTSNLGSWSNLHPMQNLPSSTYSEVLRGSATNMGTSLKKGNSFNFKSSLNHDSPPLFKPNMRSPNFESPLNNGPPPSNKNNSPNLQNKPPSSQQISNVFSNFKMRPQIPIRSQ